MGEKRRGLGIERSVTERPTTGRPLLRHFLPCTSTEAVNERRVVVVAGRPGEPSFSGSRPDTSCVAVATHQHPDTPSTLGRVSYRTRSAQINQRGQRGEASEPKDESVKNPQDGTTSVFCPLLFPPLPLPDVNMSS
ncbi:uncharacterized protein LOC144214765 [Stigmatopora nigra]